MCQQSFVKNSQVQSRLFDERFFPFLELLSYESKIQWPRQYLLLAGFNGFNVYLVEI